jgi:hypothetical protein
MREAADGRRIFPPDLQRRSSEKARKGHADDTSKVGPTEVEIPEPFVER